ncbi:MAG: alpha/beta fold hydrolase [Acidocella sp.]|uniref:alpha/beta fold hydrolase n=1 Tax=Acidocella sp. TaxID=50710 RepID=UPI003FC12675
MTSIIGGSFQEVRPGRTLHAAVLNKGVQTSLFFLHGSGGNKEQFRFLWEELLNEPLNLIAWDAPGHGASPDLRDPAAYAGTELLADARALIARYGTARNILVAHSLGTRIALATLAEAPEHFVGAVLLGPPPPQMAPVGKGALFGPVLGRLPLPVLELLKPLLARRFKRLAWAKGADLELIAHEQQIAKRNTLFVMQALFAGLLVLDPAQLAAIRTPVRILAGAEDALTPPAAAQALAAVLPAARLTVLPGTGHQIMLEQPEQTLAALRAAMAGD